MREREPELTGAIHGASLFPDDLQCDPRAIARALAREAAAAGAEVREGCAVEAIVVAGGRVTGVRCADGPIGAGAVVVAAGPWSAALAGVGRACRSRSSRARGSSCGCARRRPGLIRHKVVDGSYLRSVTSAATGLEVTTVVETTWEGDVLVGSSRERRGFDTSVDPAVSAAMVARAARLFPRLPALPVAAAWAGLRPWLPDHRPAIGPSARRRRPLARHRPRGRRRRARPRHGPPDRPALHRRAAAARPGAVRPGPFLKRV